MTLKSDGGFGDLTLGVLCESWDFETTAGFRGAVGFRTDLKIFDFDEQPDKCETQVTGALISQLVHQKAHQFFYPSSSL